MDDLLNTAIVDFEEEPMDMNLATEPAPELTRAESPEGRNYVDLVLEDLASLEGPTLLTSLPESSRIWRVFKEQEECLVFARQHSEAGLMPFVYHHCNCGRRYFLATHPLILWHNTIRKTHFNYNYEIIAEGRPSKIYLDLEFKPGLNPNHDGIKMTSTFIKILTYVLASECNIIIEEADILILESSTENKFSRHVIFQSPLTIFKNNIMLGKLIKQTCRLIENNLNDLAEVNICTLLDISREDLEMLKVKTGDNSEDFFVDVAVYTTNRHFRVMGSTKPGRRAPLIVSEDNKFKVPFTSERLRDEVYFLCSLVTYTDRMSTFVLTPAQCVKPSIPKPAPELEGTFRKSPFPLLDAFITTLIDPSSISSVMLFDQRTLMVFVTSEAAYCSNIDAHHEKSRVLYVVNVKKGIYYQKCQDSGCRGFQSKNAMLPFEVQIALGLDVEMKIETAIEATLDEGEKKDS